MSPSTGTRACWTRAQWPRAWPAADRWLHPGLPRPRQVNHRRARPPGARSARSGAGSGLCGAAGARLPGAPNPLPKVPSTAVPGGGSHRLHPPPPHVPHPSQGGPRPWSPSPGPRSRPPFDPVSPKLWPRGGARARAETGNRPDRSAGGRAGRRAWEPARGAGRGPVGSGPAR